MSPLSDVFAIGGNELSGRSSVEVDGSVVRYG